MRDVAIYGHIRYYRWLTFTHGKEQRMPSMTERVYPREMDSSREIQRILKEIHLRRYRLARDWLKEHLGNRKLRVIDIACGSGFGTAILSELGDTVGVDIDSESIEYAKKHYRNGHIDFQTGNADDTEFLNSLGRFDAIISSGTIEHIEDPITFLGWIKRSLNHGGACVVCFPSTLTMDWATPHHKRDIKPRQATAMFTACGFKVRREYVEGHRLRMRDLRLEIRKNPELPVPPLKQWIAYYLGHPHHLAIRLYQMTVGKGILFEDQEYLLSPTG
jgi:2-polyprenyl-3-methyl-5-hydroxy-6-metoxy-1,4-benzoquinol methylase